jgi:hypothetical protein
MQQWGIPLTEVELADFLAGEDERGAEFMVGALHPAASKAAPQHFFGSPWAASINTAKQIGDVAC